MIVNDLVVVVEVIEDEMNDHVTGELTQSLVLDVYYNDLNFLENVKTITTEIEEMTDETEIDKTDIMTEIDVTNIAIEVRIIINCILKHLIKQTLLTGDRDRSRS